MDRIDRLLRLCAAARLAGVERGTSYGTPSLKVAGKFLAREKDSTTLAIRCPLAEKEMLMAAEPEFYFETDHYRGYDAILVRMDAIDDARLTARLERAWLMQAGKKLIKARG
jgi:hypothetical protein